jgi:hypothetical protein
MGRSGSLSAGVRGGSAAESKQFRGGGAGETAELGGDRLDWEWMAEVTQVRWGVYFSCLPFLVSPLACNYGPVICHFWRAPVFTLPVTGPVTALTGLTGLDRLRYRPVINRWVQKILNLNFKN